MHYTLGMKTKQLVLVLALALNCMAGDDFIEKIKETRIKNGCDPDPKMADFAGAVYRGGGDYVASGNVANGAGGPIIRAGNVYHTPQGVYTYVNGTWLRPDGGAVVQAKDSFVSWDGAMVRAKNVYVGNLGASVGAGNVMLRPSWASR